MLATSLADRLLPSDTVTFLFTDIEGSTRLWETHQAAMQEALAHHDAILREAIEANGGRVVKTTGDGANAAFANAADAIAACVAAQRALHAHPWGELHLKSRMALHSGAAEQRGGDYYGPTPNRAARLMAAAHGGQVLLTSATGKLARDHLPAGIALRDLGERRLKDLVLPEHVFQLLAPDLPADFPPLNTLDARPNNLPAQTTPFIGRESEIRAVRERLADPDVRLVTLTGVGGTGKTRLALQVAAVVLDEFEHGVYFVPLAPLSDPALVLQAIAKAFDVREAAGLRLEEQLLDYLREKQMLLVIDNFEHVIDAAPRVSDILTAAPGLKVLVTSREVLRLSGETEYSVPPLSLPDLKRLPPLAGLAQYESVALFVERAVAAKPGFTVTNENAAAVAEICHRLDGLPLAIELAAARVRVLTPQRMLPELRNRLAFLVGGARDLSPRQNTLRGAIDWSHDLLTGVEQQLFRRQAVFVGGCALEAIEAVCNAETSLPVLATVESLVGKSLVKQTEAAGEPRFAMLETIREYAGERLHAAGEGDCMRDRHRDYFLALAEEANPKLTGAEQTMWLHRLEQEHDNMRSALEWSLVDTESGAGLRFCAALQPFWTTRGHLSEGREWCARALEEAGTGGRAPERGKALNAACVLTYFQGDYPAAWTLGEASLAIKRQLGDQSGIASSLNNLGNVARQQGDFASARALHEEALAIRRKLGDRGGIASSLNNLGLVAYYQADYQAARALFEECRAISRELGDRKGIAYPLVNLGLVACEQDDYPAASALFEECLVITRDLGDRYGIGFALEGRAAVLAALGNVSRAARIWGAAERLREEIGSPLPPNERPRHDRRVGAARASLGDEAGFDCAWREGRALTLEQAIDLALEKTVERA